MPRFNHVFFALFFLGMFAYAQVAPDCGNAVPMCNNTPVNGGTNGFGDDDFNGARVSGCLERTLDGAIESNSAWYRFRTGEAGQLGFNIGIDSEEDWDFALYRSDDCGDLGDPVRCNFFDNMDANRFLGVGEDPTGRMDNVQYEDWLQVEAGEDYYLFLNNFSNANSGFSVQFSGDIFVEFPDTALDCSIIDNLLGPAISSCRGETVVLDATTPEATDYRWFADAGSGFAQIAGEHDPTLSVDASSQYRVEVVRPTGNIISEVQVAFSAVPLANPVADEASCSGIDEIDLSPKDAEVLADQDPENFVVSYHASLADATNGTEVLPKRYPPTSGSQTIYVRVASIDNPKCFNVSQSFRLISFGSPVLEFPDTSYLCEADTDILLGPANPNPNHSYRWNSGETVANIEVARPGEYMLTVTNTEGGLSCSATRTITVISSRPPTISDIEIEDLSNNNTIGIIADGQSDLEYRLDDGAYQAENVFQNVAPGRHTVTVNDPQGCGSVSEEVVVIGFPKFFTPNNDGSNDVWHISGLELLQNPSVSIFDRYGKLMVMFEGSNYDWTGTFRGRPLPESDYWFRLTYTDDNGQTLTAKYIDNHFALKR